MKKLFLFIYLVGIAGYVGYSQMSLTLSDSTGTLAPNTTIYKHNSVHILLAKAYDDSGNVGTSDLTRVVVLDITKPTVKITNPINGGKMPSNSIFTISAFASDVSSVIQVEFRVNGTLKCTSYKIPYVCSWKIPAIKGVINRIEASALDTAGNIGTQSISVTSI